MKTYELKQFQADTGETIAYRESNTSGQTVLLVHGNMSSSVHFQPLMETLEEHANVYALDLPGFGDSSYNRTLNSLKDFSADVLSFIEYKKLTDIHILGWSTGGGIALEVAAARPELIEKVYLLNSVGVQGFEMYKKGADFQPILTERIYKREDIAVDPVQVVPALQAYETNNRDLLKQIWEAAIYNLNRPNDEDYELYIDAVMKQRNLVDVDVALTQFNILHESNGVVDGTGLIDDIKAPVVIIHGEEDLVVPVAESYKTKEAFGDQAELIIIEGVGHSILTDDLKQLTEKIIEKVNE